MKLAGIEPESIVDGPGIRMTIFISGCLHNCSECHNKEAQSFDYGLQLTPKELLDKVNELVLDYPLFDGLTISGGDPLYSAKDVSEFIKLFKEKYPNKDIWLYTGFVWEYIINKDDMKDLVSLCDILVDGLFDKSKKDFSQSFKGSSNQRFIDIKGSLNKGELVLWNDQY